MNKAFLLSSAIATAVAIQGCGKTSQAAAAAIDFTQIDLYAESVFSQVVEAMHSKTYATNLAKGFAISPLNYEQAVSKGFDDGTYTLGKKTYYNIRGAAHAPRIKDNLKHLELTHKSMSALFRDEDLSTESRISPADVREYYRFTAEFLGGGGFNNSRDELYQNWGFDKLVNITRTGIFISQLAVHQGKDSDVSFGLLASDSGGNPGGSGSANGMSTFSATTYDDSANSCPGFKTPEASKAANCISPADGSALWPDWCTDGQSGAKPDCGSKNCGKKVTLSANGHSVQATICGACPHNHPDNIQYAKDHPDVGNACADKNNIDMDPGVYNGLHYNGENQRKNSSTPGSATTFTWSN